MSSLAAKRARQYGALRYQAASNTGQANNSLMATRQLAQYAQANQNPVPNYMQSRAYMNLYGTGVVPGQFIPPPRYEVHSDANSQSAMMRMQMQQAGAMGQAQGQQQQQIMEQQEEPIQMNGRKRQRVETAEDRANIHAQMVQQFGQPAVDPNGADAPTGMPVQRNFTQPPPNVIAAQFWSPDPLMRYTVEGGEQFSDVSRSPAFWNQDPISGRKERSGGYVNMRVNPNGVGSQPVLEMRPNYTTKPVQRQYIPTPELPVRASTQGADYTPW